MRSDDETTPRRRERRRLATTRLILALLTWPLIQNVRAEEPPPSNQTPPAAHDKEERPYWRTNIFKRVFSDQKFLVTQWWPAEFRKPGFTIPLAGATLLALTSQHASDEAYDFEIGDAIDDATGTSSNGVAGKFTQLGNGPAVAALLGVTYLSARWSGHDHMARTSSLATESMLDAGIWIEVLKHTFARVRPNNPDAGRFFMYGGAESNSCPSGHAMGAFAVATVFAGEYRDKRWVPWVAYGTAGLISASRVALGRHFPSDVVVGGIMGNSIGRGVLARQHGDDLNRPWLSRFTPLIDPARAGIGIAYTYSW